MAQLRMIFLYVGQGDGTFIILPDNQTILVDLGSLKNSQTAGANSVKTVADELTKLGKTTIDYLFITHKDRDHNNLLADLDLEISGMGTYTYPFEKVFIGGVQSDYGSDYVKALLVKKKSLGTLTFFPNNDHDLATTPRWPASVLGGVQMFLLSSNVPANNGADPNPKSLVLMLVYCGWKIILSGDAEQRAEDYMMNTSYAANQPFLKAFCLKLGHHGAETATTDGWLQVVLPSCAVISSDQKWAHPYCSVLDRVKKETTIWKKSNLKHGYVCGTYNESRKRSRDNDTRYLWTNYNNTELIFTTLVYADDAQDSSIGGHYELLIRDTDEKMNFVIWTGLSGKIEETGWFNTDGTF